MKRAALTLTNEKHGTKIRVYIPADIQALRYGPGIPFTPEQAERIRKTLCGIQGCGGERAGVGIEKYCPGVLSDTGPHKFLGYTVMVFHGWLAPGTYYGICEYDPERNWIFPEKAKLEREDGKPKPTKSWHDYAEICVFKK